MSLLWFSLVSKATKVPNSSTESAEYELTVLDCSGENSKSPICIEREESLLQLKILNELKNELLSFNIQEWSQQKFQSILDLEAEGGDLFQKEFFGKSGKIYAEASMASKQLIEEAKRTLEDLIGNGYEKLKNNLWKEAEESFRKAIVIEPSNNKALTGLSRALVLEEVLELLKEIKLLIRANFLDEANSILDKAINLDRENPELLKIRIETNVLVRSRDLKNFIRIGYESLERRDFIKASVSFTEALRLDRASVEALSGVSAVKEGKKKKKIQEERARADNLFELEDFQKSAVHFKNILELEKNIGFAVVGLEKVNRYISLENKINRYLEKPERLSSSAVFKEAKSVLKIVETYELGERLSSKKKIFSGLLDKYSEPIKLILYSDNKTYISMKNGKDLGSFSSKEVRLFPGTYTFMGKRKGYVTIRRTINLIESSVVSLVCGEKI